MTAKWGKISLGCFALNLVLSLAIMLREEYLNHHCSVCGGVCMDIMFRFSFLSFFGLSILFSPLNIVGAILAVLGIRKKETPTIYARLGRTMNITWLVILTLVFVFLLGCM